MTQQNQIRDALEAGERVFGASSTTLSPVMIDVYGDVGLDYVWLDHEHIGAASTHGPAFEEIVRTAAAADIEPLVRVESGEPPVIRKVLDAGVRSIVVPRVETADEIRRAVRASRFAYDGDVGDRGVGTSLVNTWGNRPADYTARQDEVALVGTMLENRAALENIDEILSVPDLGFAWIGPADLSVSLGHPLELDHPEVQEAIDTFVDAGADAGVPVGTSAGYTGGVEAAIDAGYRLVNVGSEVGATRQVLGEGLATARRLDGRD